MAAPIRPEQTVTLAQFLWWEREQAFKHEFVDGVVRAMTGTTVRHNEILLNVVAVLRRAQRGSGGRTHAADLQVRVGSGRVYYPDVVVSCGPSTLVDRHARGGDGAWSAFEMSDAARVYEFATPCVETVLSPDAIYADTDLLPPGPDLPADEPPPPDALA